MAAVRTTLRYNDVRQKSVHNAYDKNAGLLDQSLYWGIRSLELDLQNAGDDWEIFHWAWDPGSSVGHLTTALELLWGWNRSIPGHEAVTVFLDLKDKWDDENTPDLLDDLLRQGLPRPLFEPGHLLATQPGAATLREVVDPATGTGWPSLTSLRGRILFALTGPRTFLDAYVDAGATTRAAFVAPGVDTVAKAEAAGDAIFFNLGDAKARRIGRSLHGRGWVTRTYYVNRESVWRTSVFQRIHHLATDRVDDDETPWASTRDARGWPFERILPGGPRPPLEADFVQGLEVRSEDIGGRSDSGLFRYRTHTAASADRRHQGFVACAASGIPRGARAGLVARAGLGDDAPYLGVFRLARNEPMRVQIRPGTGQAGQVEIRDIRRGRDVDADTLLFVRLDISDGGRRAQASASVTGRSDDWVTLGSHRFDTPLRYQGFAACSDDGDRDACFLYGPHDGIPAPFDRTQVWGGARGRSFRGMRP